jgi:geranylgeranyl pyrophosphate synthase
MMLPDKRKLQKISPAAVVESNLEWLLGDDLARVRQTLQERAQTAYPLVNDVMADVMPDHLTRAMIVLGTSRLGHAPRAHRVALAAAIEMLHMAVSVHAFIPRGDVTVTEHQRVVMGSAILIGDYCFSQASTLAASTGNPAVVAAFADALAQLSERRVQTLLETPHQPHADDAILYAAAAEVGALLVKLPMPLRYALREAAASFGEVITDSETSVTEAIMHLESLTKDWPGVKPLTQWLRTHRPTT